MAQQQKTQRAAHQAHLVITETGIATVLIDEPGRPADERAGALAESAGGVVVALPVTVDHRPKQDHEEGKADE